MTDSSMKINPSGDNRLLEAAADGKTDLVLHLLEEEGSKLHDQKDENGKTALHVAASAGHIETVAALTLNGADVTAQDHTGHTALQRAAAEGHVDVVHHLIDRGAPVDHQDEVHGNTALHEAAWKGFSRTVTILCKNRSNYYLRNRGGFSPLHLCCQNGHNETCRVILRAGCKPNIKNNYGDTPLHTAARYGHAGVARILLSAQANQNLQNKNGDSPLHIAAAMGRRKLVRILMERGGADLTVKNQQQETPVAIADRKQYTEISAIFQNPPKIRVEFDDLNQDDLQSVSREQRRENGDKSFDSEAKGNKNTSRSNKKYRKSSNHRSNCKKDPAWSPYGCHYYPDLNEFPVPKIESLPTDPLCPGEQYYLDLAGNIRKGPVSNGSTCYCTPFIQRFEQKLDRNKRDLVRHLETTHGKLAHRILSLEKRTKDQISSLSNCMKETIAQERVECQDRAERRAIRDRVSLERQEAIRDIMIKGDLSTWLDHRLKELEKGRDNKNREEAALMRTLLRGSRRRKRAVISEIQQTGSLRRALSEDELGPGDIEDNKKQDEAFMLVTHLDSDNYNENLAVQSEFGGDGGTFGSRSNHYNPMSFGFETIGDHLEELHVSDHPHIDIDVNFNDHLYQNTVHPKSTTVRVRRSSVGDEATTIICDFGDFKTQELIEPKSGKDFQTGSGNNFPRVEPDGFKFSTDVNQGQSSSSQVSTLYTHYQRRPGMNDPPNTLNIKPSIHDPPQGITLNGNSYQNFSTETTTLAPPVMPKPVRPFSPALFHWRLPNKPSYQSQGKNSLNPPHVLPKHFPPPYRPPPPQPNLTSLPRGYQPLYTGHSPVNQPLQNFFMPPIEEDNLGNSLTMNPLMVQINNGRHTLGITSTNGALSSSDGGSHDSHNDSGYYALRSGQGGSSATGSGGPSPSLSGSHGRPDSRGHGSDDLNPQSMALRAASIGILNSTNANVAPRIRHLQHQLTLTKIPTTIPPISSTSTSSTFNDSAIGIVAPRGSLV